MIRIDGVLLKHTRHGNFGSDAFDDFFVNGYQKAFAFTPGQIAYFGQAVFKYAFAYECAARFELEWISVASLAVFPNC